jgi:hypothetical protein
LSIASPGHVTVIRNVTLSPRADLALGQIRLETGRLLTVQVTDAVSGAPLNAQAWWRANGAIALREDRADGTAVTLPAGEVNLEVGAMDHLSQTVKVAAAQSTLAVQLDPGSVVTGRVTRADGRPLAGRWYVFVACGANEASGLADANGLATLKGVAPGNCTATAGAPNGAQRGPAKPLVVPAHGTASVDVVAPGP